MLILILAIAAEIIGSYKTWREKNCVALSEVLVKDEKETEEEERAKEEE